MAEKKKILYIVEAMGGGVFTYIVDIELGYSQSARRNNTFSVRNDDLQFWLLGICSWNYLVDLDL